MSRKKTMRYTADEEMVDAINKACDFRIYDYNPTAYARIVVTERLIKDGFLSEEKISQKITSEKNVEPAVNIKDTYTEDSTQAFETPNTALNEEPNELFS